MKRALTLMHSCGMYDYSGEFAFNVSQLVLGLLLGWSCTGHVTTDLMTSSVQAYCGYSAQVGLPAKSGVSGVILAVIPGKMGLCMFSPPVNKNGNSVRGLHFCKVRSDEVGGGGKRKRRRRRRRLMVEGVCPLTHHWLFVPSTGAGQYLQVSHV